MMKHQAVWILLALIVLATAPPAEADSRGDELAAWLDQRGREVWGKPPEPCDDLTLARRLYLDVLGRVPSVSELRDFEDLGINRREQLVEQLVLGEGPRRDSYRRLTASHWARQWRRVLVPPGTTVVGSPQAVENWLRDEFEKQTPFDEMIGRLVRNPRGESTGGYYELLGSLPENYAGHLTRAVLGIRIECAQCHDHPFADWKQGDFWGLAAFYSDLPRRGDDPNASTSGEPGKINYEGTTYTAKYLWSDEPIQAKASSFRGQLAEWVTSPENPHFASTAANRFWQMLVGRGVYADVENLDEATSRERALLDELGRRFADDGFNVPRLVAAICKTSWYQAETNEDQDADIRAFVRQLKVSSPEQVFDSLEQSLLLPVSRLDPTSSRWTGDRLQLVARLSETIGATPEDYASGIPQALMMMNGKMTNEAIDPERSRLLRAVVDSPFFNDRDRIKTLYMAVLTRPPSRDESEWLETFVASKKDDSDRTSAYGEILWALLNSPEFVLCR